MGALGYVLRQVAQYHHQPGEADEVTEPECLVLAPRVQQRAVLEEFGDDVHHPPGNHDGNEQGHLPALAVYKASTDSANAVGHCGTPFRSGTL